MYNTRIEPASNEKSYRSLISFNDSVTKDGLEAELIRLIRFNVETIGIAPHEICILAPPVDTLGKHDPPLNFNAARIYI